MSKLISALDTHTPSQIGENGSVEYTWSNDIRERIVQLSFQLTRTRDDSKLAETVQHLLTDITRKYDTGFLARDVYKELMSLLYRMVGHTRDLLEGKGEYALSYMLLCAWEKVNPSLAAFAFKHFLVAPEGTTDFHPYGSWKDIKYLYHYNSESSLVEYGLGLLVQQLRADETAEKPSLAAKWTPRQKSKHAELFTRLAIRYYPQYFATAKTDIAREKAMLKAKTEFRKLLSALNVRLDTVQVKQCDGRWAEIEPTKQTSITMHKQKKAFLNLDKKGEQRSQLDDRIICAQNFSAMAQKAAAGEVSIKGQRVGLNDFTAEAIKLIDTYRLDKHADEVNILNAQWLDNSKQTGALGKMIAMVDVSGSMDGDPLNAAIALGIRIAEKSLLGKRVLTFSATPSWANLDGYDTFVEMVSVLKRADWGMNTNFYAAAKLILDAIIANKLAPEDVEDMVLAILSDMQIDAADKGGLGMMATIENMYAEAGKEVWGRPFKAPHILFWNLRSTSGFPTLSTQQNCSMMSGFSPALLNLFCDEGLESLQTCTPWSLLVKSLDNERYSVLGKYIDEVL
jgi:hypothetical protein